MLLRNISFAILTTFLLAVAGGGRPQESPGADGNGNGMAGDTTEITGTVESVRLQDSMLVVNTDEGEQDTVYWNSETEFTLGSPDQVLRTDTRIRVMYITQEERNIATRIEPAPENGEAQQNGNGETEQDTNGMIPSPDDEDGMTPPPEDGSTPPNGGEGQGY